MGGRSKFSNQNLENVLQEIRKKLSKLSATEDGDIEVKVRIDLSNMGVCAPLPEMVNERVHKKERSKRNERGERKERSKKSKRSRRKEKSGKSISDDSIIQKKRSHRSPKYAIDEKRSEKMPVDNAPYTVDPLKEVDGWNWNRKKDAESPVSSIYENVERKSSRKDARSRKDRSHY